MGWVGLILTLLYYKPDSTHSIPLITLVIFMKKTFDYINSIEKTSLNVIFMKKMFNYVNSIEKISSNVIFMKKIFDYVNSMEKMFNHVNSMEKT